MICRETQCTCGKGKSGASVTECPVEDEELEEPSTIHNKEIDTTYTPSRTYYRTPKTVRSPANEGTQNARSNAGLVPRVP